MSAPKGKEKLAVWMYPEIKAKVKEMYRQDDCRSMSEFVEKSIRFYVGYLTAENKTNYLPNMFLSCLRSIIRESDNRHSKMILSWRWKLLWLKTFSPISASMIPLP